MTARRRQLRLLTKAGHLREHLHEIVVGMRCLLLGGRNGAHDWHVLRSLLALCTARLAIGGAPQEREFLRTKGERVSGLLFMDLPCRVT